ncbi:MAG: hypothetical protein IT288_14755 [Bdellovibrionales bacterium]|nr:hypothetical protein [Bdellovibrionales bacterium]
MLDEKKILSLFENLNQKLAGKGEIAEIGIVGGAVMCLVFHARKATRDIDGIFKPTRLVRDLVAQIADEEGLSSDWLNDAAKGFIQGNFQRQEVINLSNLRVWAPEPRYMLAMKCVSARWDTSDRDDVQFLIGFLKLKSAESVFSIIESFYPKKKIPPKTRFLIEELYEG